MAAMIELANSLQADLLRFGHLYKFGRARSAPTLEVDRESLLDSFEKMINEYRRIRRFYSTGRHSLYLDIAGACEQKISRYGMRTGCGVGLATFTIAHDGTVFPCPSIFSEHLDYGSIVTDEPSDLFERAQRIAEEWGVDRLPHCHGCEMKYFCGGGCRASALATRGDPLAPDPYWMNPEIDGCSQVNKLMEAMWNFPDYRKAPKH
jgi:radical SAM protein with 4Fe4S-binding SPASM domain